MAATITSPTTFGAEPLASDYEQLKRESGIPRGIVDHYGIRRVTDSEAREIVGANGHGNYSGLLFPIWGFDGKIREYCVRRDHPDLEQKADGSKATKRKYVYPPGRGNVLMLVPGIGQWWEDPSRTVVITEGVKKAISLQIASITGNKESRLA